MEFDSKEEAYDFYNAYSGQIGFSIRKQYGNKVNGRITSWALVCSKEGVNGTDKRDVFRKTLRAETQTNCSAQMVLRYDKVKAKYVVSKFVESHNHPFIIVECSPMMPSQRRISLVHAIDIELASDSGVPACNAYELMGRQSGGKELVGYLKVENYLRMQRQNELLYGDSAWLVDYFETRACEDHSLFYSLQLDTEQMIVNIF
ncbi:protein FAR1-RELATED SEQUENCE 5-like [Cornus florida]|uniref:protein FAR1-RELATED SEQUENCE 5-like n=1 Tax=Cornus florida TaxID=4283 RepID=UPI0028996EF8|nr:protein FAR1-RELATED SEQUENCE 5-like [Cornus florida]